MDKRKVLETLFDPKVIRVLRLFINNPSKEYYLREVSRLAKVPPATAYRIIRTMKGLELLHEEKTKHLKTYYLNQRNAAMFFDLLEDKRSALKEFVEFMRSVEGVERVIQHGDDSESKASILVVGVDIDQEAVRAKVVEIKERYGFTIIHLVLAPEQYKQMLSMGLYSGRKITLV